MLLSRVCAPLEVVSRRALMVAKYSACARTGKYFCTSDVPHPRYLTSTEAAFKGSEPFYKNLSFNVFKKNIQKGRLKLTGDLFYENVADSIDYPRWFAEFRLSDSFNSWFIITELHVWMLMVRCTDSKEEGTLLKSYIVESFWDDTSTRVKKLKGANTSVTKKQITTLHEQFNAAIIAYDEGLLTADIVLAGAIWRRFFNMSCDDPILVEKLVKYIRKHIKLLDSLSKEQFFGRAEIKWGPLSEL